MTLSDSILVVKLKKVDSMICLAVYIVKLQKLWMESHLL
jgi:hypothetical protein